MWFVLCISGNKNNEIPGCPTVDLEPNRAYVFFLNNKTDDYHEIEFEPLYGEPGVILDDLTIYCGLHLEMPIGKHIYTAGTKLSISLVLLAAFANQYSEISLPSNYLLECVGKVLSSFV